MEELIKEGFALKQEIDAKTARLREINTLLADKAEYKNGSNTGRITCPGLAVKVTRRNNEKWDQTKLAQVREHFPAEFEAAFKAKYEPVKKALSSAPAEFQKAAAWAVTVTPGAPTVTYETLDINEEVPF